MSLWGKYKNKGCSASIFNRSSSFLIRGPGMALTCCLICKLYSRALSIPQIHVPFLIIYSYPCSENFIKFPIRRTWRVEAPKLPGRGLANPTFFLSTLIYGQFAIYLTAHGLVRFTAQIWRFLERTFLRSTCSPITDESALR